MKALASLTVSFLLTITSSPRLAQTAVVEFDAVSIKRHVGLDSTMAIRTSPDGTTTMTNVVMTVALSRMLTVPLRDVVGLPEWARTERFDIIAKTAERSTREQQREMWRLVFERRMNLAMHSEDRERDMYALVVGRTDGRLGPDLKPSTLDCRNNVALAFMPTQTTVQELQQHCGIPNAVGSTVASGGISMDQLARFLEPSAGALIENRTALTGLYAFTLTFSTQRLAPVVSATIDDLPDVFAAIQEQLGLKLEHGKKLLPVVVIDHMERPTED